MRKDVDDRVAEGSSERIVLQRNSVDLVLTDPPCHDGVQYGQLSLPFRAWADVFWALQEAGLVAVGFFARIGTLQRGWERELAEELARTDFLADGWS